MEYHPLRGEKRRRDSATSLNVYICHAAWQARKTGRTKCWRGNGSENNAKTNKDGFARLWLPLAKECRQRKHSPSPKCFTTDASGHTVTNGSRNPITAERAHRF